MAGKEEKGDRMRAPSVAIDGPAGAGKSTVAKRLAERLGFLLVDTGALYRTVALAAKRAGAAWDDEPSVAAVGLPSSVRCSLNMASRARAESSVGSARSRSWSTGPSAAAEQNRPP